MIVMNAKIVMISTIAQWVAQLDDLCIDDWLFVLII